MDAPAGALPAMRSPDRWLAGLRIALGVWFAKAIFTKLSVTLAWGFLPLPTASDRILRHQDRHDVLPAIGRRGHRPETPRERDAQPPGDGLREPPAPGGPPARHP